MCRKSKNRKDRDERRRREKTEVVRVQAIVFKWRRFVKKGSMMATDNRDLVGSVLGECRLERLIGRGGMSSVYLGRQTRPARHVAVKVLGPQMSSNNIEEDYQTFLIRFRREADIVAKLEHVNIVPLYAYGEENQFAYIIMPYISGGSLSDVIREKGRLSLQQTLIYLQQAAAALDYAHARNVVHRDLKPSNFLLYPEDNRLVLADFGIARIAAESPYATHETTLTQAGAAPGTLAYMAPEMLRDGKSIDYRVDIYALGIVLYQMLSGELPFKGDLYTVINKQLSEPLPPLHPRTPSIPISIDTILRKATAKAREERYTSAGELARDFRIAIEGVTSTDVAPRAGAWDNLSTPAPPNVPPWNVPQNVRPSSNGSPSFNGGSYSAPGQGGSTNEARGNSYADATWSNETARDAQPRYGGARAGDPVAATPAYQQSYQPASPVRVASTPGYSPPPRKRRRRGGLIFLIALILVAGGLFGLWATHRGAVITTPPTVTPTAEAEQVIQQYYTDINNRDYRAAYALLTPGFQSYLGSYNRFAAGYANTKHDDISFGTARQPSAGNVDVVTTIRALEAGSQGDVTSTYRFRYRIVRLNGVWKIQSGIAV